jgi:signal peptide peptidase SppA
MSEMLKTLAAAQTWAMERVHLSALIRAAHEVDLSERLQTMPMDDEEMDLSPYGLAGVTVQDGLALVPVQGSIVKEVPMWWRAMDCQACGMIELQAALREIAADPQVQKVLLVVDSPGGTVSGVAETAGTVARLNRTKPVYAAISDLGASAAYWIASQARQISANGTAHVGSIGVYTVLADTHMLAAREGVDVTVVSSGAEKGAGIDGTKLTPVQLAAMQENIDDLAAAFFSEVQRGRRLTDARLAEVTTGRTWIAPRALALGLVDKVESLDVTVGRLLNV